MSDDAFKLKSLHVDKRLCRNTHGRAGLCSHVRARLVSIRQMELMSRSIALILKPKEAETCFLPSAGASDQRRRLQAQGLRHRRACVSGHVGSAGPRGAPQQSGPLHELPNRTGERLPQALGAFGYLIFSGLV